MTNPRGTLWREVFAEFERLSELDAPAQRKEMEALARARPDLQPLVSKMFLADAHAESAAFLEGTAQAPAPAVSEWKAGDQLGAYRLERTLGSGGMGEVWLARRADGLYDTPVALKLLHPHFARSGVRNRFLREGRILGRLSHPHIAHLLDAGVTNDGQLYLAIEHVEGEPLDQWCDGRQLSIAARLHLMQQICEAVAHAHAQLIVHRDLKPSNILVGQSGEVKLLDFGIAKLVAIDDASGEITELTQVGSRVFTPQYAAPEQISGLPVTVATDVYALGILLYSLLCGQRPYGHTAQTLSELERKVLEVEPPAPSRTAVSTKLKRELSGDLDTIVLKALKKNPAERYASVAALAEDLERYLQHQPVLAQPDSLTYRARKYLQRHRVGVSAATTIALALVAGLVGTLWQAQRATAEAQRATATKDFLIRMFRASDPRIAQDKPRGQITAKELLDLNAHKISEEFADDPQTQIELLGVAASIYRELDDEDRYQALHRRQTELARERYGELHPAVITGMLDDANRAIEKEEHAKGLGLLGDVDPLIRRGSGDRSVARARWWLLRGQALVANPADADQRWLALRNSAELYEAVDPGEPSYVTALEELGNHQRNRDPALAVQYLTKAIEAADHVRTRNDAAVHWAYNALALARTNLGDIDGAEHAYDKAAEISFRTYGESHWTHWLAEANRARFVHMVRGDPQRAHALFERLLKSIPPGDQANTVDDYVRQSYGFALTAEGRPLQAIPILESVHDVYKARLTEGDDQVTHVRMDLGNAYASAGQHEAARPLLEAALDQRVATQPPDNASLIMARELWGRFLLARGDLDGARAQYQAIIEHASDRTPAWVALARGGLAEIAMAREDRSSGLRESTLAIQTFDKATGLRDVRMGPRLWLIHSRILLATGNREGAREWADKALVASKRFDHPSADSIKQAAAAVHAAGG